MIKQAFVLGAGLGKRLRPLTESLPKPLIPIYGKPLITFALDHLCAVGVESFVINTHHLADQLDSLLVDGTYADRPLRLVHEPDLLETGGGIKNVEGFLAPEPFIVYSGDILTDIELKPLIQEHFRKGNDVTLALRETGLAAGIALRDGRVIDINSKYGHVGTYDFANVSIWNPTIFPRIPAGQENLLHSHHRGMDWAKREDRWRSPQRAHVVQHRLSRGVSEGSSNHRRGTLDPGLRESA